MVAGLTHSSTVKVSPIVAVGDEYANCVAPSVKTLSVSEVLGGWTTVRVATLVVPVSMVTLSESLYIARYWYPLSVDVAVSV